MARQNRLPAGTLALVLLALVLLALVLLAPPAAAEEKPRDCSVPSELIEGEPKLPLLAQRLAQHQPVTIVAIGSSSTAGIAAQSPDQAYPQRLQEELGRRYPGVPIKVVNKGVPHQTAQQMADRFPQDVFPEDPVMAIWETGTTEAVRGIDVEAFAATLEAGITALRARHIEVMLVDMQFSKRTASVIGFDRYLDAMHRFADLDEVALFRRFEIMKSWSERGTFNFEDVPKSERADLAAAVYICLAQRLADTIDFALR
jgi:acyl-CoA thioesterase I